MSGLFLINIKKQGISFDEMDDLANKIVRVALEEKKGVFFNALDYDENLIGGIGKSPFFLISNSFLYQNCDFLDTDEFDLNDKSIQLKFNKKYSFILNFLNELKRSGINEVEIFISNDGAVNKIEDFVTQEPVFSNEFLYILLQNIYKYSKIYAYGFPTIKYTVILN